MPQPRTVEGAIGNLDKSNCKDNALGKAFYTLGRPSVRVSCQVECTEHNLSKIPTPSMHHLKREISLSKACMAWCSQSASAPSATCAWGFSPMATRDLHYSELTDEYASMRPPLSLIRERASHPV
jgi:hypothetical protein